MLFVPDWSLKKMEPYIEVSICYVCFVDFQCSNILNVLRRVDGIIWMGKTFRSCSSFFTTANIYCLFSASSGTWHAVSHISRAEGIGGYFRGWVPSVLQIMPFTGVQFALYKVLNGLYPSSFAESHESTMALINGAASGTIAKTVELAFFYWI